MEELNNNIVEEVTDIAEEAVEAVPEQVKIGPILLMVAVTGVAGWCLYKTGEFIDKKVVKPIGRKIKAKKENKANNAKVAIDEEVDDTNDDN